MPTTFNVFSLGNLADIDTVEGNNTAENASALVGLTFGGVNDALLNDAVEWSPGTGGFGGGFSNVYDMRSFAGENFQIDGGADQAFDGTAVYNATITYTDGSTATITAVIAQDKDGNAYWAPEFSNNADQAAIEAGPIRSLTLDSLAGQNFIGLTGNREESEIVMCFTAGVRIETPAGPIPVEALASGNLVTTRDNGAQPIRWIGTSERAAVGVLRPIRIRAGALGMGLPQRDMMVSQQHRMLLASKIAERLTGSDEVLVPAKKLIGLPGIEIAEDVETVTYYHLLLDRHEILYAEGAPTESLFTGPNALEVMGVDAICEIETIFPGLIQTDEPPAREIVKGADLRQLVERHIKNNQPVLSGLVPDPSILPTQSADQIWSQAL